MALEHEMIDGILKVNVMNSVYGTNLEDSDIIMGSVIDKILQLKRVERIILAETREYEYDYDQTKLLLEVADVYDRLATQGIDFSKIGGQAAARILGAPLNQFKVVLEQMVKRDPIGAYVKIRRMMRQYYSKVKTTKDGAYYLMFVRNVLEPVLKELEKTKLISLVKDNLYGYVIGNRDVYRQIFNPLIRPIFMLTRYAFLPPKGGRLVERYDVQGNLQVEIYRVPNKVRYFYHLIAPEFKLTDDKYAIINSARSQLTEHKPGEKEFTQPERAREIFLNIGKDMINQMAAKNQYTPKELEEMVNILVRYTAGFGILELLLSDTKLQDIYINSPIGITPVYVLHDDYEECETNLIPTREDAESWATRFRLLSGRPLDEANPVLDTELFVPGGRARVGAITRTLSPEGLAYALRRHRDRPWTYPLFMNTKYMNSMFAGLMSFLVDGSRTILFAGGRSSGKSSLLGATMLEMMKKFRVISLEDTLELPITQLRDIGYNIERMKSRSVITRIESELPADDALRTALRLGDSCLIVGEVRSSIRGDQEVLVIENNVTKRVKIKDLENRGIKNYNVPTLDFNLKMNIRPLADFVKHPPRKKLIEITTKTGRKVTVTPDHSLFTATKDFRIAAIECDKLKPGNQVVIPSKMLCGFNDIDDLNLIDILPEFRLKNFEDAVRRSIQKVGWKKATEICKVTSGDIYNYFRAQKTNIPVHNFVQLMKATNTFYEPEELMITRGTGNPIPAVISVNEDFCKFLGYYVAEGYYDLTEGRGGRVVITNSNPEIIQEIVDISNKTFNIKPSFRSITGWGKSTQVHLFSSPLSTFLSKLECGRTSGDKRIPPLIFGLNRKKIAAFLRGLYSGDGNFTKSIRSGNAVRYYTTSKLLAEDLLYLLLVFGIVARIKEIRNKKSRKPLWTVEFKDRKMVKIFLKEVGFTKYDPVMIEAGWEHTKVNMVYFDKIELKKHLTRYPRKYRHLFRFEKCSKKYLERVVNDKECQTSGRLKNFAGGDFFLDEIVEIKEIELEKSEFVYDLSVNPSENFVGGFGGILLHNTEARALFEAMRIGALSNVVAGTIHGESPYGVFDRVVNDLGVTATSFKAIDVIVISGMIKSGDGLHRYRRILEVAEVRKHWKSDPMDEKGFVTLMEYSAKDDELKPTGTLLNGESLVVNEIAKRVRDWHGNWEAVWDNIELRAKMKQTMVDYANRLDRKDILEAEWVSLSNEMFHLISDDVKRDYGVLNPEEIFNRWDDWLRRQIRG